MPQAIESFDLSSFDVVLSSSGAWSKGILTKPETTHICYCHAPMRYAWDWHAEYLREHTSGLKKYVAVALLNKIRVWDYVSSSRPDIWIANSQTTQKRLKKYYHVDAEVIYPPVATERFAESNHNPVHRESEYYLIVSRLEPYKRIDLAIAAMKEFPNRQLIIIGNGSARRALEKIAGTNVTFLGHQPDDVVTDYVCSMYCFLFPGEDDFGIAPVEAAAAGKPVIAFGRGGACETVRDNITGILFHEATPQSLIDAMQRAEQQAWDATRIKEHAQRFRTDVFTKKIAALVDTVVSSR